MSRGSDLIPFNYLFIYLDIISIYLSFYLSRLCH